MEYSLKTLGQFKLDYRHHGKFDLDVQVPHLAKLANFYEDKYKMTQNWTDCLKVCVIIIIDLANFIKY